MKLIQLPIPDEYVYINVDHIMSLEFNAYNGQLTIIMRDNETRVFYSGAKRILDKIIEEMNCTDGIPNIPKKEKPKVDDSLVLEQREDTNICDLIF